MRLVHFALIRLTWALWATSSQSVADSLPIMMGASVGNATQFVVLYEGSENLEVYAEPSLQKIRKLPFAVEQKLFPDSQVKLIHYRFMSLNPHETYKLVVKTLAGKTLDERNFKLPAVNEKRVKFAVASCMDSSFKEQEAMWEGLLEKEPQLIFLIGDNAYTNLGLPKGIGTSPARLWSTYVETRKTLALFRAKTLTPVIAMWDDNDYGMSDGDRTFANKEASTKTFHAFFAQHPLFPNFTQGPGLSLLFNGFGHRFFFMDNRSNRSEPAAEDETHWGEAAEKWLFEALKTEKTPTWIISGDQFFGGYHKYESLERNHPKSFERFTKALGQSIAPVALISGDRHLTELMKIPASEVGFETFELTTSPIHAKTYLDPWKETPNKRQLVGVAGVLNYAIVDSAASAGSLKFRATVFGPNRKKLYEKELEVKH